MKHQKIYDQWEEKYDFNYFGLQDIRNNSKDAWEKCEYLYEIKIKYALEILSGEASSVERINRAIQILEGELHGKV